jgi:hypothetical protein
MRTALELLVVALPVLAARLDAADAWRARLVDHLGTGPAQAVAQARRDFPQAWQQLQVVSDWLAQDELEENGALRTAAVKAVVERLTPAGENFRTRLRELEEGGVLGTDPRWAALYLDACERRRAARLAPHRRWLRRVVFTKHYDLGGSHYAYTEGQSDAQAERHFKPGSSLCVLELEGLHGSVRALLEDPEGVIRDPDVSHDGRRILFAWKKSLDEDDYHLYEVLHEMEGTGGAVRQLTSGLGFADYEGAYLPGGDIVFNSTRCVQIVDCWWTEVSNLFTCDGDGRYLRRLSFDQVHTNYPTVTPDGRVIYTRWDYSDRGQIYPQGLFQMNPDGTAQTELYGNNSWFPTTILHARAIPGTGEYVAVLSGHHTRQQGWLALLDPALGRQENSGVQLIAPVRATPAVRIDRYGQSGDQFQYPYPLSRSEFLVTFRPQGARHFAIYFMTAGGERELLASDPRISCNQPVPLVPRPVPHAVPSVVDYRKSSGMLYVQDIHVGPGLRGIRRGTVKRLRVVALEFRAAGIGSNGNRGPAGSALVSTPISIEGAWDVKKVLGDAKVYEDGSACFTVPARTPIYFQALDERGHAVQTMRSWMMLQPGEQRSCVGCHEGKNTAPPLGPPTLAQKQGPRELAPWRGAPGGFSFIREIQPILDQRCVRCHHLDAPPRYGSRPEGGAGGSRASAASADSVDSVGSADSAEKPAFSLKGRQQLDPKSRRKWSDAYKALADRRISNWINAQSEPSGLPPYHAGAARSRLISLLEDGHYGVKLSRQEKERFATWIDLLVPYCGDYTEAMDETGIPRYRHFLEKRRRWEAEEAKNLAEFMEATERGGHAPAP